MERSQREETASQPAGVPALKNFTIPRKKRTSGQVLLEPCSQESRDYSLIHTKLRDSNLDTRTGRADAWIWRDVALVHSEELLKHFSEKRAEMRAKGRHGREMEESFCFLAASDQTAGQICEQGLRVGSTVQHALGKPSLGVYLFKHVDVALKSNSSATKLIVFKVLYGKVKKVAASVDWNKTQDPTVSFDCHVCKDAASHRDALHQQVLASAVFLFDYNGEQELSERPRQCLPYAVVSFVPASSAVPSVSANLPLSPSAPPAGQVHDRFKACTVAERRRKGNSATVTFKRFGAPDYPPQSPAPLQNTEMQNTESLQPKRHPDSDSSSPAVDHTPPSQNLLGRKAFTHARNDRKWDSISQSPLDKISTIVYSSRSVRDPRLSRQEAKRQSGCSEAEDKDTQPAGHSKEDGCGLAGNKCESNTDQRNAQRGHCFSLKASMNDQCVPAPALPSMKLFKMKFQKYAAYFRLSEEERRQKICSHEHMSPEQKQELSDRIHFYEAYYQKYKKGLLFQKVTETNETPGLPLRERRDNKHQSEQAEQHQTASVSDHNDTCSTKHIHETRHPGHPDHPDHPSAVMLTEEGRDHQEHPKTCLIQSPEQSLVLGSLNPNLTNEKADAESVRFDLKRASAFTGRSNEALVNDSSGCERDLSRRAAQDMQGTGSAPAADLDARPGAESSLVCANNISAMDIASCVEVSTLDSCNLSLQQKQNGEIGSGAQEMDSFRRGKLCERNAETSPELDVETVQLYARLQLDQLLPSTDQKAVFSSRAYLTPRVMGRPADNVYKTKNESKDHSEAAANLLTRCSEDLRLIIVTLEANNMSGHEREMISLSERFSKIKGLQKPSGARNNKGIRSPGTQTCEGLKEAVSCNSRLIQRLAQSFSKAKIYMKSKSLSRRMARVKKQHTVRSRKRRKYAKNKHFWKAKKNLKSETENNEIKVPSNSLSLSPEKDQDPEYNSRSMSHTSESDNDRQEANAFRSKPPDQRSPAVSVIRKHPAPSTGSHTIPESKEEAIRPTDLCSEDLCSSVYTVKTSEDLQVRTTKNISDQHKTALTASTSKEDGSITESKENGLNPVSKEHFSMKISDGSVDASESYDEEASKTHSDLTTNNTNNSHRTEQTTMTLEAEVMETVSNAAETETIKNELNTSSLNVEARAREHVPANIPNINQSCLKIYTNTSNGSSVWRIDPEPEVKLEALRCASSNVVDLTVDDPGSSGQCEISAEHAQTSNTDPLAYAKSPRAHIIRDKCDLSRPERNKKDDVNSPETQLISKLRDYLTKFESTVKKQEAVNEDLKERPLVWITLDSTAHKQQLFEKGQYCMVNLPCLIPPGSDDPASDNSSDCSKTPAQPRRCPRGKRAQTGADVCLLVPVESKRGRQSSQSKCSRRSRRSSVTSVSPDSTSVLDTIKDTSPRPLPQANDPNTGSPNISISNTCDAQLQMQSRSTTGQQNPSAHLDSSCERKSQENQNTIEIIDDGDVSSTFADNEYSISDISNTLKLADETTSLPELASLQSKCKSMLQHFISSFERDQKVPFNQSFVSMCLILEQYLDHPPPQVDLKYEAVNSYLELQMMMEAWQFIENKMNFMRGKPTFRSLLWYDPSLYGELYKGEVGFQQQSSLFASFQSILAQEGYSKLQEYYTAVSSLHQQLYAAPDASYYMYLKSKRELLEAEAALRNPQDIKSFFLSVPVAAMINFGDSLERLEKVHKVLMTFVETPSDRLPGTFDVGKAEHLSIACRYLQEKALFLKSCKVISKISWFGIEHLLYDASKILVWQDMRHSAPSEVLKTYKNSNPQIIFGVTESGVALVNKVEQPLPSTDGAETKVKSDAARKRRGLQLWMSSQPSAAQSTKADKEVAYNMAKRRASHPPVTQCNMTSDGANLLFQTTPASRVQIPRPYYSVPRRDPGRWGTAGGLSADWTASSPSTSHAHSETHPHLLSKGRVTDVQRAHWPSVSAPRATLRGDACVTRPPLDSVKYRHNSPAAHRPVLSQAQEQHFSLAMTQPYSLANCPLNASVAATPALSVQPLTHVPVPVPRRITAVHYPYFLLNGQTYTSGSAAAIPPETRYYPNTMGQ